ncbi:MAG: ABC transporter permease, partial [Elusimicrobia bacterium]|nr:ABC transporter permease [Elusimicrobiota bacterium]
MNISESFMISVVNLQSNKIRAFLSMLGIIIGISSVIVIISITEGAKQGVLESIGTADSLIYTISPKYNEKMNRQIELTNEDLQMFQGLPFSKATLPKMYKTFEVRTSKKLLKRSISLMTPGYLKTHRLKLLAGRNINDFDVSQMSRVCLISKKLAKQLYDVPSPLSQTLYCGQSALTVVGIIQSETMESLGTSGEEDSEESMEPNEFLIPYTTALRLETGLRIDEISLYVDKNYKGDVMKEIKAILERNNKSLDDLNIQDPKEILAQIEKQTLMFSTFLASIASISLLVGGVGIMNVMLT